MTPRSTAAGRVPSTPPASSGRWTVVPITLWAAQAVVGFLYCFFGLFKLTAPMAELVQELRWPADYPVLFTRSLGLIDILGGIGMVVPALTRILPRLTVWAAAGAVLLQVLAISFHVSRGEWAVLWLNAALLLLASYVVWGRSRWAPIHPLAGGAARQRTIVITLWAAQAIVSAVFIGAGMFKMSAPIADLAAAMKWPGELPPALVRLIGAIDLAGGLGILLPALTRIQPRLTVLAALGCAVLQVLAIVFHVSRGEWSVLPLNAVLLPCALYVLWGRTRHSPVLPRDAG